MGEPEIIFNLWYVFDDTGMIYSLRTRAYVQNGSDEVYLSSGGGTALKPQESASQCLQERAGVGPG
jgi:hypothetical protein